mgnify:FL=1
MFNTSSLNYEEVGDYSKAINAEQDAISKSNETEYAARGAEAVRMANQRSRNFQKFGELIKQGGQFKKDLDTWNEANALINSSKATDVLDKEITGKDGAKKKPVVPIDQLPQGATVPIDQKPAGKTTTIDKKEQAEQIAEDELSAKSNEAGVEAKKITGELENEIGQNDSTAAKEEYIAVKEAELINDYSTRGAALTNDLKKDHEGFITSNLARKVKLEGMTDAQLQAGGVSVSEALQKGDLKLAAQLQKFWDQSWYSRSGIFKGGDNYLGRKQKLALLKETNAATAALYRKGVDNYYNNVKKAAEVTRQGDFAKSVNTTGITALVGDGKDPNSGYIAQYEYATGTKNTPYAYELAAIDLEKKITDGSIPVAKAEAMIEQQFKHRGTKKMTTLQESQPEFYNRISKHIDKTKSLDYLNSQNEQKLDIQTKVKAQLDHIKTNLKGEINEKQLTGLVEEITNELNITEAHPFYKELEPLLEYRTAEDKVDQDVIKKLEHDYNDPDGNGHIDNLEMRLNEINDTKLREKYRKKYESAQILEIHKDGYKADLKIVEDHIDTELDRKSNVNLRSGKNNQISYNAKLDFRMEVEDLIKKGVPPELAFKQARIKVIERFDKKNKDDEKGFQYMDKTLSAPKLKNKNITLEQGTIASDLINNAEVQEDLLHQKEYLPGEKVHQEQLINYLAGKGPMPLYYLQMGVGAKNYTSHEIIQMRGKALDLLKGDETTIPEARLDKTTKGLFCHFASDGKAMRGLMNVAEGTDIWTMPENGTDAFPSSTDILKSLQKNPLHESFVSPTGGKRIDPTETSLGEVNDLMKTKGYGLYGGVGIYGHTTGDLNKAIEILGPDILQMPYDQNAQDMVEQALFMYNIMGKQQYMNLQNYQKSIKPLNISFTESADLVGGFGDDLYTGYNSPWCLDGGIADNLMNNEEVE